MIELTTEQRENLDKLATYLEKLPYDYKHFDMDEFIDLDGNPQFEYEDELFNLKYSEFSRYARENGGVDKLMIGNCGTVACAIGHGPAAGILLDEVYFFDGIIRWRNYSHEKFIYDFDGWYWCFGSVWKNIDNHPWGASARIRYLLDDNDLPIYDDEGIEYLLVNEDSIGLYENYMKTNGDDKAIDILDEFR